MLNNSLAHLNHSAYEPNYTGISKTKLVKCFKLALCFELVNI